VKTECDDTYCFHLPFNQSLPCLEKLKAAAQNKYVTAVDETGNPLKKKLRLACDNSTVIYYLLTPWSRVLLEKLTSELCS
jgi:hypothetical protein